MRWEKAGPRSRRVREVKFTPRTLGEGVKTSKSQHHKVANHLATVGKNQLALRMLGKIGLSSGFELFSGVTAVQTMLREKDNPGCWRLFHDLVFRRAKRLASPALFPVVLPVIISAEEGGCFCI